MIKYLLSLFVLIGLTGCSLCPKPPQPEPRIIYKVKEVKVPVKCKIPKINCDFNGTNFQPTVKLLECIVKQKRAIEMCQ